MSEWERHPIVKWELTRLCDQRCHGCPTGASSRPDPNELSTYEAYKTIDQIAALAPRELIITGGDPLERSDVFEIIDYARRRGLNPSLVLTPSPELTLDTMAKLERYGLTSAIFPVDGAAAPSHEAVHATKGTFGRTMRAMRWAKDARLRVEVDTLVLASTKDELPAVAALIRPFHIARWNVHFLVPVGASRELPMITAAESERVFEVLESIRRSESFPIRAIEAPHYRRFRVQQEFRSHLEAAAEWSDFVGYATAERPEDHLVDCALDGARSFVYISHAGDVRPSEFAPQSAGNLRYRDLGAIYRGSDLFVALRDPINLHGRCGRCEFRVLCGGSRARAYAMSGDLFGSDPLCAYEPGSDQIATGVSSPKEAHA